MAWDELTVRAWQRVYLRTPDRTEWYEPWVTILQSLFTHNEGFGIMPLLLPPKSAEAEPDRLRTFYFVVRFNGSPVFFVKVKPFPDLDQISTRGDADIQMVDIFEEYARNLGLPRLYGISAMGPQFAVYHCERESGDIFPVLAEEGADPAPAKWWAHNVMNPSGEAKLRRIAAEIKQMVAAAESQD